jgi:hypothetical protein
VAVDAELGIVGKVGAEFQEERPEVLVDAVMIAMATAHSWPING